MTDMNGRIDVISQLDTGAMNAGPSIHPAGPTGSYWYSVSWPRNSVLGLHNSLEFVKNKLKKIYYCNDIIEADAPV